MNAFDLLTIHSVAELREHAAAWDDLWRRSDVTLPLAQAEFIAQWVEHFAPRGRFQALVVRQGDAFVAALPVVERRLKGLFKVGALPSNEWSPGGELLLDPARGGDATLDLLARSLDRLAWPLLWLEGVNPEAPWWRAFLAALDRAGLAADWRESFRVGQVEIGHDWNACQAAWSRNHRRALKRATQKIEAAGDCHVELLTHFAPGDVEPRLRQVFEVEDRSWKGPQGTSVLRTPGMFDFFLNQARQLARQGELALARLEHMGEPIAAEYAFTAKGVYFPLKIGYAERYSHFAPGQLLMARLVEQFQGEADRTLVDYLGPLMETTRRFATRTYATGRLVVAPPKVLGRALMYVYRTAWPRVRALREKLRSPREPAPVAATADDE